MYYCILYTLSMNKRYQSINQQSIREILFQEVAIRVEPQLRRVSGKDGLQSREVSRDDQHC